MKDIIWKTITIDGVTIAVSEIGQVKGVRNRILKPNVNNQGYERIWIGKRWHLVHRLVLTAYIGEAPTPKHQGAHNDGNRRHNAIHNLRWATASENALDRCLHGTVGKLSYAMAAQIRASKLSSSQLGKIYHVSRQTIWRVRRNKIWDIRVSPAV